MANYVLQELPEGMRNNENGLFPKIQTYTLFDYDKVVKLIHSYSPAFSEGVIRGVLDGLTTAMKSALPNGHNMKIDGLGVFSLSLGFSDEQNEEASEEASKGTSKKRKEKYRHVCVKGINFKADKEFVLEINRETTFERDETSVRRIKKSATTPEQRLQSALLLIKKQGFITLSDYANANEMSRTAASRELKHFASDPASGIAERGAHSHKVWVSRK